MMHLLFPSTLWFAFTPAMASLNRRQSYTVSHKLMVIEYAKEHGNCAADGTEDEMIYEDSDTADEPSANVGNAASDDSDVG